MKLTYLFAALFILFAVSCENKDNQSLIQLSTSSIEMEAEGGEAEILVIASDWNVAGILNVDGGIYSVNGDVYNLEGELIRENNVLYLNGLGEIHAFDSRKGLVVSRETESSINIRLQENSTGKELNFVIQIQSGEEVKEINIVQKRSQGYQMERIEYSLQEGDGDSLFVKNALSFQFDLEIPQSVTYHPINGVDIQRKSFFRSEADDAFVWFEEDSLIVEVPTDIQNNIISLEEESSVYNEDWKITSTGYEETTASVTAPAGKSEFIVEVQFRKRKVSYTLHLINNRTKESKTIEGKWIEISPTGAYTLNWR